MADKTDPSAKPKDPIIQALCKDFGPFQQIIFFLIFFSKFPSGYVQLAHIFLTVPTEPFCADPEGVDVCSDECNKIDYNRSVFKSTIITEWDLVCDKKHLANLTQSIVMFGIMTGAMFFGIMGDKFGRKVSFCWSCVLQLISGLAVCIAPWFIMHCVCRFLVAFATGGGMVTGFILLMEYVGPSKRELATILYQLPFNMGHAYLPLAAYFLREWRWYYFSFSIISVGYLIFFCTLPESARWLLATGQPNKAKEILEKGAARNNCPTETVSGIVDLSIKRLSTANPLRKGTMLDLFRTPVLRRRTILMAYNWLTVCLTYFGVSQYVSVLSGNIFLNVFFSALCGIPGTLVCIVMTKYLGRKISLLITNLTSGISLFLIAFLPPDSDYTPKLQVVFATIGLFGASITFPNVYLYAGELFPTIARNSGVGFCSFIGRIGSISAPFVTYLSTIGIFWPPIIFGVTCVLAFIATIFIPETRGAPLPETVEDVESLPS